jgi:uncharacterized glyoxalase superfamily protein PhnB
MAKVKPIPEGYEAAIPYLCVKNGSEAIDFYRRAFGATEKYRMEDSSGTRKEDLSVEEMKSRAAKLFGGA